MEYAPVNAGLVNAVVGANEGLAKSWQDRGAALKSGIAGLGNQVVDDVHAIKVKNWIKERGGDPRAVDGGVESTKAEVARLNEIDKAKLTQSMGNDPASLERARALAAIQEKGTPTFGEQQGVKASQALGAAYSTPVKGTAEDTAGIPGDTFPTSRPPTDEEAQRRFYGSGAAPIGPYSTLQRTNAQVAGREDVANIGAASREKVGAGHDATRVETTGMNVAGRETVGADKNAAMLAAIDRKLAAQQPLTDEEIQLKKAQIDDLANRGTNRDAATAQRDRGLDIKQQLADSIDAMRSGRLAEMSRQDQRDAADVVLKSAPALLADYQRQLKAASSLVNPDPAAAKAIQGKIDELQAAIEQAQGVGRSMIRMGAPDLGSPRGRMRGPPAAPTGGPGLNQSGLPGLGGTTPPMNPGTTATNPPQEAFTPTAQEMAKIQGNPRLAAAFAAYTPEQKAAALAAMRQAEQAAPAAGTEK